MDRRTHPETTATRVTAASNAAGVTASSIAQATGIPAADLNSKLSGDSEFTINELGLVGGLFRVLPSELIGDAA